ncbi:hypothetical protein JZ751_013672 [Albula glossodonta]|uniref:Uncharacterized protein n=1 Tax=Albula glossodonta TaxID=121402 RepID=A0A8T2NVG5_9TELE|nr:hypothetical protein JZ751_013672 [Albula glossodonta]
MVEFDSHSRRVTQYKLREARFALAAALPSLFLDAMVCLSARAPVGDGERNNMAPGIAPASAGPVLV